MTEQDPRIPVITERDEVPSDQRDNFDSIAETRGRVGGPFSVLMNSPEVAGRVGHLGAYIRFEGVLNGAQRELAIITTSREYNCPYEWQAHAPLAREEGVDEAVIEAVANQSSVSELGDMEAAIISYGRELIRDNKVSDETFQAAKAQFDVTELTELTATFGYYGMLATVLNAFEVTPDEGTPESW